MASGPGKHYRKGISLIELMEMFPDDKTAEQWFTKQRWPNGVACVHCGSVKITLRTTHPTMPYRCGDCHKFFSVKTNSVMHSSKIGYRKWALAIYIVTTELKGTSSMRLHREIGVTQKTAWNMAHRIRESYNDATAPFAGPVEVDETYFNGKSKNMHASKRLNAGRGTIGKTTVVGAKDGETNQVSAAVVSGTDKATLQEFVEDRTEPEATVYTDDHPSYSGIPNPHKAVKDSVSEYVDGMVHTNGIESFWATLKRGYHGTYHHLSPKHLNRYVGEFSGRHNDRTEDTVDQMTHIVRGMDGKRLRYEDLVAKGRGLGGRLRTTGLPESTLVLAIC